MRSKSLKHYIAWCGRVQWTLSIGICVVLGGFFVFGYRPAVRRIETLQLQIESKRRELEQNQHKAQNLPILAFEVQKLEGEVENYDRQFPKAMELDRFIKDITRISQSLTLAEWKYQPGAPRKTESYFELPIQMHFEGDFLNATSFLRQVEDLRRLTRVRKLDIKSKNGTGGHVEVEVAMNIYFSEG